MKLHIDVITKQPILTMPKRCNKTTVEKFLVNSRGWYENHVLINKTQSIVDGQLIIYKGKPFTLHLRDSLGQIKIDLDEENHTITIYNGILNTNNILKNFFKQQALIEARYWVDHYAYILGVAIKYIGLKDYRARWGCCSSDGAIHLSWRLIMAPLSVLQYVAAHEVAHRRHLNHSPQFWQTVTELYPDHKIMRRWLREQGLQLFQI